MFIERAYLGTWFPRTSIHLDEVYHFLLNREGTKLDQNTLKYLWDRLGVTKVTFSGKTEDLNSVDAECGGISVSISEDGIILLSRPVKDHKNDIRLLEDFYTQRFGPALMYLFSRGAPLPKLLTRIEEIYPRILITRNADEAEIAPFFGSINDKIFGSLKTEDIDVFFGNISNLFNLKHKVPVDKVFVEELLENIILFREFERQLASYLNLHRVIWDQISVVHESPILSYRDFPKIRGQILEFLKTVSFVKARLAQMGDNLTARVSVTETSLREKISELGLGRFETLKANLGYISDLWQMTSEYADNTSQLLESLSRENTQRELRILQFVAALGLVTGFFGMNIAFPWEIKWETHAWSFLLVFSFIVVSAFGLYYLLRQVIMNRRFTIRKKTNSKAE